MDELVDAFLGLLKVVIKFAPEIVDALKAAVNGDESDDPLYNKVKEVLFPDGGDGLDQFVNKHKKP